MSTNGTDTSNKKYDDEIELRELIMILWNRKFLIIGITLIFAALAGLFTKAMVAPVYQTKFSVVAKIPETYATKYGDYELPITNSSEYVNLLKSNEVIKHTIKDLGLEGQASVEAINSKISFEESGGDGQSIFPVVISGNTPEEAVSLANELYYNYVDFTEIMIRERVVHYFKNDFTVKLNKNNVKLQTNEEILKRQEELLATVPMTIDQKAALEEVPNTNDYIILENIVNPNYTHLEYNILEVEQEINTLESSNQEYGLYLEELAAEQVQINEYYAGTLDKIPESNIINNMDIYRLSEPILPLSSSGPNLMRNVVIAGLLGAMIGVFVAFFVAYWRKEI